jgi:hypothetical protein
MSDETRNGSDNTSDDIIYVAANGNGSAGKNTGVFANEVADELSDGLGWETPEETAPQTAVKKPAEVKAAVKKPEPAKAAAPKNPAPVKPAPVKPIPVKKAAEKPARATTRTPDPKSDGGGGAGFWRWSFRLIILLFLVAAGLTLYPTVSRFAAIEPLPPILAELSHMLRMQVGLDDQNMPADGPMTTVRPSADTPTLPLQTAPGAAIEQKLDQATNELQGLQRQLAQAYINIEGLSIRLEKRIASVEDKIANTAPVALTPGQIIDTPAGNAPFGNAGELMALQNRLNKLENATPEQTVDLAQVEERILAAQQQVAKAQGEIGETKIAVEGKITSVEEKIDALDQRMVLAGTGSAALALGLNNVQRASAKEGSFLVEITAVDEALRAKGFDTQLDVLKNHGTIGLVPVNQLALGFQSQIPTIIETVAAGQDPDWQSKTLARLRNLVIIRNVDDMEGDGLEAVLARMEHKLDNGDLSGALKASNMLPLEAQQMVAPWIKDLAARVAVETALREIFAGLISMMSKG